MTVPREPARLRVSRAFVHDSFLGAWQHCRCARASANTWRVSLLHTGPLLTDDRHQFSFQLLVRQFATHACALLDIVSTDTLAAATEPENTPHEHDNNVDWEGKHSGNDVGSEM